MLPSHAHAAAAVSAATSEGMTTMTGALQLRPSPSTPFSSSAAAAAAAAAASAYNARTPFAIQEILGLGTAAAAAAAAGSAQSPAAYFMPSAAAAAAAAAAHSYASSSCLLEPGALVAGGITSCPPVTSMASSHLFPLDVGSGAFVGALPALDYSSNSNYEGEQVHRFIPLPSRSRARGAANALPCCVRLTLGLSLNWHAARFSPKLL